MAANRDCDLDFDTELLIAAVQEQKCIWDSSDDQYWNRDHKNAAYERIAEILITDFKNLPEGKKRDAVNLVQRRWKTARDAYVRDKSKLRNTKSGSAAKKFKTYVYFENLRFLDRIMDLNETETNYDENDGTLAGTVGEDSRDNSENEDAVRGQPTPEMVTKLNERTFQRKKRKQNDNLDQKLISFLQDAKNADEDDDRAFLTSLLPTIKSFDEYQKLQFRAEVLRIIMEIKQIPAYQTRQDTSTSSYTTYLAPSPASSSSTNYVYPRQNLTTRSHAYNEGYGGPSSYSAYTQPPATSPFGTSPPTLTELTNTHVDGH